MRILRALTILVAVPAALALIACGASEPSIVGVWQPDDGSGLKTVGDDGSCSGMYYNNGAPRDIGGGMRCTLGEKADDGTFLLLVQQPPNERSYRVRFEGDDTAVLISSSGETVVTLERQ